LESPRCLEGLKSPKEVVRYLLKVACNKAISLARKRQQPKNKPGRIDRHRRGPIGDPDDEEGDEQIADTSATSYQIVVAKESLERMLARSPPIYREMIILRAKGDNCAEASRQLHLKKSAAERFFERFWERNKRWLES
jgi:DNA-directed RNA polymerase specialized sigma24 family protein